jgi:hypothetical protein
MDQWNGEQRAVTIKMFYMFGFFKSSVFWGHPVFSSCTIQEKLVFVMNLVVKVKVSLPTSELNGGQRSSTRPSRFIARQRTRTLLEQKAGRGSERFGTFRRTEKCSTVAEIPTPYGPHFSLLIAQTAPEDDKQVTTLHVT